MSGYYESSSARAQWIALWVFWIVFSLLWISSLLLSHLYQRDAERTTTTTTGDDVQDGFGPRVRKTVDLARDLTLFLLLALTFDLAARGSTTAVTVLAWIYVGVALIWLLVELTMKRVSAWIRVPLGFTLAGMILAQLILAFAWGWSF